MFGTRNTGACCPLPSSLLLPFLPFVFFFPRYSRYSFVSFGSGTGLWDFDCVGGDIVCDAADFPVGGAEEGFEGVEEGGG